MSIRNNHNTHNIHILSVYYVSSVSYISTKSKWRYVIFDLVLLLCVVAGDAAAGVDAAAAGR